MLFKCAEPGQCAIQHGRRRIGDDLFRQFGQLLPAAFKFGIAEDAVVDIRRPEILGGPCQFHKLRGQLLAAVPDILNMGTDRAIGRQARAVGVFPEILAEQFLK